jgi:catechol 2,3-dioxygenase-like lactoylglutathione lyase family enzyme
MSMPPRLSVVTLGVRDLPLLRRFYGALGWPEVNGSDDEWCGYLVGGALVALYPLEHLAAESGADAGAGPGALPAAPRWSGVTLACNVDSPTQVDSAFQAAVAAGASPISAPVAREWGGRSGYIADPEGNRWEIAWAPGARFDERGALIAFGS